LTVPLVPAHLRERLAAESPGPIGEAHENPQLALLNDGGSSGGAAETGGELVPAWADGIESS